METAVLLHDVALRELEH